MGSSPPSYLQPFFFPLFFFSPCSNYCKTNIYIYIYIFMSSVEPNKFIIIYLIYFYFFFCFTHYKTSEKIPQHIFFPSNSRLFCPKFLNLLRFYFLNPSVQHFSNKLFTKHTIHTTQSHITHHSSKCIMDA